MAMAKRAPALVASLLALFVVIFGPDFVSTGVWHVGLMAARRAPHDAALPACVLVRTYHANSPVGLFALLASLDRAARFARVPLQVTFTDTDAKPFAALSAVVALMRRRFAAVDFHISAHSQASSHRRFAFAFADYGYVSTDLAVRDLVESGRCAYVLITNGDNLYAKDFFASAIAEMTRVDVVRRACLSLSLSLSLSGQIAKAAF